MATPTLGTTVEKINMDSADFICPFSYLFPWKVVINILFYVLVSIEYLFDDASNYIIFGQEFFVLPWREMH